MPTGTGVHPFFPCSPHPRTAPNQTSRPAGLLRGKPRNVCDVFLAGQTPARRFTGKMPALRPSGRRLPCPADPGHRCPKPIRRHICWSAAGLRGIPMLPSSGRDGPPSGSKLARRGMGHRVTPQYPGTNIQGQTLTAGTAPRRSVRRRVRSGSALAVHPISIGKTPTLRIGGGDDRRIRVPPDRQDFPLRATNCRYRSPVVDCCSRPVGKSTRENRP